MTHTIEVFGQKLLETLDLDPVYVMLVRSHLPMEQKERWCVAYWLFYHSGVASVLSEAAATSFWRECQKLAPSAPRGTERRHFRGPSARKAIAFLSKRYQTPNEFVTYLRGKDDFRQLSARVQEHYLFGPWISFKIGDMLERVLKHFVSFDNCALDMYKEPLAGATMAATAWGWSNRNPEQTIGRVTQRLYKTFCKSLAPPQEDRYINLQEIETILCKWKAHCNGHYPIGKDTRETKHMLLNFPCLTSRALLGFLPLEKRLV